MYITVDSANIKQVAQESKEICNHFVSPAFKSEVKKVTFYNRHKETDQILSYINSGECNNKIIVLVGKTGVGKSGLAKMLLDTKLKEWPSLQIHVSKSSPDTIENLYYINAIYRAFVRRAEKQLFDDIPTPQQQGIISPKNLFRFGKGVLWAKAVGTENRLYEPVDEESVIQKRDYIVSLLKKKHYIINIDNIQNIDSYSFEIMKDIIQRISNTTFILEYTLENTHTLEKFSAFYNEWSQFNAEICAFEIGKLDFEEAKKIAPENVPESQLKSIYLKGEGNLVQMLLSSNIMCGFDDPIHFKLSSVDQNEKFVLNLIFLNAGEIKLSLLYRLLLNSTSVPTLSESVIEDVLDKLKDEKILADDNNGMLRILHDSIISELETQPVNPSLFLAFHSLKEYYMERLAACPDEDTVEHLFRLFLRFSDEDLLFLFPYVRQLIINCKYKHPMIIKLIHFRELLVKKGTVSFQMVYELSLSMTALCVELGFADEAQNNLDLIYNEKNAYHRALQAAIYTLRFTDDESMKKAEEIAKKSTTNREKLTIELLLLAGNMARSSGSDSLKTVRSLLNVPQYQELFEYAYLLRDYAELVSDYDESLRLYGQVLKHFRNAGRRDLSGQIFISMSMFSAYKGKLKVAKRLLEKAENSGNVPLHYRLNNKAVISILERTQDKRTVAQLNDALLIAGDPYERCIIKSNLLVCYTLMRNQERAASIYNSLQEAEYAQFTYEEFLHIIYQNMYFYNHVFGNASEAKRFKDKIRALLQTIATDSMVYRLASLQLEGKTLPTEFYSSFPFRADFLGDWSLEISRDLERS